MVQFGKKLLESRFEPWAEHYLDYHGLKKCLPERHKRKDKKTQKHKRSQSDASSLVPPPPPLENVQSMILTPATTTLTDDNDSFRDDSCHQQQQRISISEHSHHTMELKSHLLQNENKNECHRDFEAFLESEVEKIGLFFLHIQGELANDLAVLRKQQQSDQQDNNDVYAQYHSLAVLMLHLIHFVESNVTGMRKILKKHDKITKRHLLTDFLSKPSTNSTTKELKHLWSDMLLHHYDGITALHMTLKVAVAELKQLEQQGPSQDGRQSLNNTASSHHPKPPRPKVPAVTPRHQSANSMPNIILTLEDLAESAKTSTTSMTPQSFHQKKYGSTTTGVSSTTATSQELDIILFKIEAAQRRMHSSSNTFQKMLAAQIVMLDPLLLGETDSMDGDGDDAFLLEEEDASKKRRLRLSRFLNLTSTFLYMTNYYVVAPTSGRYAKMLGGDEAMAGIIIGMTPIAALVSTILYSWWTSHSYKAALVFASTCSILGNIFYAIALPCNSLTLVMIGRLLNGFGSARSINRRYIADTCSPRERTAASANFVTAGALGMAAGPAIASLLHIGSPDNDFREGTIHKHIEETIYENNEEPFSIVTDDDKVLFNNTNAYWTPENAPGWFMLVAWSIYLVFLCMHFDDPPKHVEPTKKISKDVELANVTGEMRALLTTETQDSNSDDDEDDDGEGEIPLWRNIPVMTTFFVYFVLKLVLECLLSSTSTLTSFYFDWDSSVNGIYLAVLGLLMLPANLGVAFLARRYDDRELILACQIIMLLGCCGIIQFTATKEGYSAIQYILFSVVIFLSTNAMEGPNMSLLSKTIPKSWSQGIFNVGLLATEAGTLGRAVGDLLLSAWGFKGLGTLLNLTFRSMSIWSCISLALTLYFFEHLEPFEKDL